MCSLSPTPTPYKVGAQHPLFNCAVSNNVGKSLVGRYSEMKDEDSVSCIDLPILSSKTPSEVDLEQPPTIKACGDTGTGQ